MIYAIHIIRLVTAAAIAALPALYHVYPGWLWIPAVVSFLGVISSYTLPSIMEVPLLPQKNNAGPPPTVPTDIYPYSTGGDSGHSA